MPNNNTRYMPETMAEIVATPTTWYADIDDAITAQYQGQVTRVLANYKEWGYEVLRVGTRPTKNPAVTMLRAEVRYNPEHTSYWVKANAANLCRALFPSVGDCDFYKPDDDNQNIVIVVWFNFDAKPFNRAV